MSAALLALEAQCVSFVGNLTVAVVIDTLSLFRTGNFLRVCGRSFIASWALLSSDSVLIGQEAWWRLQAVSVFPLGQVWQWCMFIPEPKCSVASVNHLGLPCFPPHECSRPE